MFSGKPISKCCSFLIFESDMLFRAVGNELSHAESIILLTANFGLMFNMKNSSALGGSFLFVGDDNGTRVGIGPRYRKWLSPKTALDISPRILFGGDDNHGHRSLGYSLAASLSLSDLMSFDSYYQILPYEIIEYDYSKPLTTTQSLVKNTESGLYLGVSGKSYLAPLVPLSVIIILVIALKDFHGIF